MPNILRGRIAAFSLLSLLSGAALRADSSQSSVSVERIRVESEEDFARIGFELAASPAAAVEITIAAGRYVLTDSLRITRSHVSIIGEGKVELALAPMSNCPVIAIGTQKSFVEPADHIEDITVRSIAIDGNRLEQSSEYDRRFAWIRNNGIDIRGVKGLVVEDVDIRGCRSGGLVISWGCSETLVYRSRFSDNHFDGLAYYDSTRVFTIDCVSERNQYAGISLDNRLTDCVFVRCRIESNGDVGVFARNSDRLYFKECELTNSGEWAFFLAHDDAGFGINDSAIVDCDIRGNLGGVLMASVNEEQSRNNVLVGNRFEGNDTHGRGNLESSGAPMAELETYDLGDRLRGLGPKNSSVVQRLENSEPSLL